jgi:hypothetical protein
MIATTKSIISCLMLSSLLACGVAMASEPGIKKYTPALRDWRNTDGKQDEDMVSHFHLHHYVNDTGIYFRADHEGKPTW